MEHSAESMADELRSEANTNDGGVSVMNQRKLSFKDILISDNGELTAA